MKWLQHMAFEFDNIVEGWDFYEPNYIKEAIAEDKAEYPKMKKREIYEGIITQICESFYESFNRASWEMKQDITENRDNIVKVFENSVIFPNLLESLSIFESILDMFENTNYEFWHSLYFSCCQTADEVKEIFCENKNGVFSTNTLKRFKKNPKLTISDYETAFFHINEFIKDFKKKQFSEAIRKTSWIISGYCKFNNKNYSETQRKIAERYEKAYQSYQYAEEKTGNTLTDRQAYDYLKKHAVENIEGFVLPDFNTWQRYVRAGRRHYGAQKNTTRTGREIKSSIPVNDPDVKQITSKFDNSDSTETV
jgi:hypothetical protein